MMRSQSVSGSAQQNFKERRKCMGKCESGSALQFRVWTEEEFAASAVEWQELLEKSDADRLFNSWNWQWHWWKHNAPRLDARLILIAAYAAGGELIGIAPFFIREVHHKILKGRRLELLGRAWRTSKAVFSEYLDLIVAGAHADEVVDGFAGFIWDHSQWSDLVMSNVKTDSMAVRLAAQMSLRGAYVRHGDFLEARSVTLSGSFDRYVRRLSSGTRRRLWNHRKKLRNPALKVVEPQAIDAFLDVLNDFHSARWGKPHYVDHIRGFHRDLALLLANAGNLRMTLLSTDEGLLSALYNVRIGGTEYNIQSGFDGKRAVGLSPGYLHLGYAIENACADEVRTFDLLAGEGQHRQYKADLTTDFFGLNTLQAVRAGVLRRLYRWHDAYRRV